MPETPVPLKRPNAISLVRIRDRLSFVYLDRCTIAQDENGVLARIESEDSDRRTTVYLPISSITTLLLGPGTSVTHRAAASCSQAGCAVSFVGMRGVRSYGAFLSPYASAELLQRQAAIVTDPVRRVDAARRMYLKRFPGPVFEYAPPDVTIEQLRGMEGARMKAHYQTLARRFRLTGWRRNKDQLPLDPVNEALNHANTHLYGLVNAVVLALGLAPGLGVIHQGNRQAFTLDIADMYKTDVTIPLAFSLRKSTDPGREVTSALRKQFTLMKLLPRIVDDIYEVLETEQPGSDDDDWQVNELFLWGPNGQVLSGNNFGVGLLEE